MRRQACLGHPGRCGIPGNESADAAARAGHSSTAIAASPYVVLDVDIILEEMGAMVSKSRSIDLAYHRSLYWLNRDPNFDRLTEQRLNWRLSFTARASVMRIRVSSDSQLEVCPLQTALCACVCAVTIARKLVDCTFYNHQREEFDEAVFRHEKWPLSLIKISDARPHGRESVEATKALVKHLGGAGPVDVR